MNKEQLSEVKKYLSKIRKLFNEISKDSNKYVDQFDTISYSLNKIDNLLSKSSTSTAVTRRQNTTQRQRQHYPATTRGVSKSMDSESDEQSEKVRLIIENCKISTETLSKKIKVLCNLPTSNSSKSKQYKEYLNHKEIKHSESANPKQFRNKNKSSSNKHKYNNDEQEGQKVLKKLDQDILKLEKQRLDAIKNLN